MEIIEFTYKTPKKSTLPGRASGFDPKAVSLYGASKRRFTASRKLYIPLVRRTYPQL